MVGTRNFFVLVLAVAAAATAFELVQADSITRKLSKHRVVKGDASVVLTESDPDFVTENNLPADQTDYTFDANTPATDSSRTDASDVPDLEGQVENQVAKLDAKTSASAGVILNGTAVPSFADAQQADSDGANSEDQPRELDVTELAHYDHEVEKNRAILDHAAVSHTELEERLQETMHLLTPLRKVLSELTEREHALAHRLQQLKVHAKLEKIEQERQQLAEEEQEHANKLKTIAQLKIKQSQQVNHLKSHLASVDAELKLVASQNEATADDEDVIQTHVVRAQDAAFQGDVDVDNALEDSQKDQAAVDEARQLEAASAMASSEQDRSKKQHGEDASEDGDTPEDGDASEGGDASEDGDAADSNVEKADAEDSDDNPTIVSSSDDADEQIDAADDDKKDDIAAEADTDDANEQANESAKSDDDALDQLAERTEKRREELAKVASAQDGEDEPALYNPDQGSEVKPMDEK